MLYTNICRLIQDPIAQNKNTLWRRVEYLHDHEVEKDFLNQKKTQNTKECSLHLSLCLNINSSERSSLSILFIMLWSFSLTCFIFSLALLQLMLFIRLVFGSPKLKYALNKRPGLCLLQGPQFLKYLVQEWCL